MDLDVVVPFIIIILFYTFIDITILITDFYRNWIIRRELERRLYKWRNTNKSKIWFVIWSTLLFLNIVIPIVLTVSVPTIESVNIATGISACYSLILGIIYLIVKNYVIYFHDKGKDD